MKGGLKSVGSYGFTIIETMIVLGVSSFLLLMALVYVGGKQNSTEFYQAINQLQLQIQSTINDVTNGNYPGYTNFTCTPTSTGLSIVSGATGQGQNLGCIFLGKAIQFGVSNASGNQDMNIYTIVGSQCTQGGLCNQVGQETYSKDITDVLPAILRTTSGPVVDTTQTIELEYGLYVINNGMYINGVKADTTGVVVFTQSLTGNTNSNLITGPQSILMWSINGTSANNESEATGGNSVINYLDNDYNNDWVNPDSVEVCLSSSTTKQSSLFTIGYNNDKLVVTDQIYGDTIC